MTLSTSAVAVCCCSIIRGSCLSSSRVFSMAITACLAKLLSKLDLLVAERSHLRARKPNGADRFVFPEHRHRKDVRTRIGITRQIAVTVGDHARLSAGLSCR